MINSFERFEVFVLFNLETFVKSLHVCCDNRVCIYSFRCSASQRWVFCLLFLCFDMGLDSWWCAVLVVCRLPLAFMRSCVVVLSTFWCSLVALWRFWRGDSIAKTVRGKLKQNNLSLHLLAISSYTTYNIWLCNTCCLLCFHHTSPLASSNQPFSASAEQLKLQTHGSLETLGLSRSKKGVA